MLFVSHHLDEVLRVADRVTVLRDGRLVVTADVNDLTHDRLVELMLGRELLEDVTQHVRSHEGQSTEALLQVSGLRGETVAGIDLEVPRRRGTRHRRA